MKLLILGGTRFLGRAVVDAAVASGHDVTMFNRGRTNPGLYPDLETVIGDRTVDLSALSGRHFDAVADIAGYHPDTVAASVDALRDTVDRYVFVSSLSVYADQGTPQDETGELLTGDDYGGRKAACERVVVNGFGERASIVRAGMIVGPYDPTDRFAYWPRRYARGGRILLPGNPCDYVQFIDVRDLAAWITAGRPGVFNVTGRPMRFGAFLDGCRAFATGPVEEAWVSSDRLLEAGVDPWMGVPMWIADPDCAAINEVDSSKAISAGLTLRSLTETLGATAAWDLDRGVPSEEGLTAQAELRLLERLAA